MSQKRGRSSQQKIPDLFRKKPARNASQTIQTSDNSSDSDNEGRPNTDISEIANHLTRYIILNVGRRQIFRRHELQKIISEVGKAKFDTVLEKLEDILENIYGLKLQVLDKNLKSGVYLAINKLDVNFAIEDNANDAKNSNQILLFLVLAHIFMSLHPVSDKSLFEFLKALEIDEDVPHPIFGNIKDVISNYMVKNRYVATESDPVTKRVTYSWGPRAEIEISKKKLLDIVCLIYGGLEPKHFADQLQKAEEQDVDD